MINLDVGFDIIEARLLKLKAGLRESSSAISLERNDTVSIVEIELALIEVLDVDDIGDILNCDIDTQIILELLTGYNFERLRPEKLCEIVLEESIIPLGIPIFVTEAQVKLRGEVWVVHKNDADPFPSNPHAHNYQQRLKMHLGTGDLYIHKQKMPCKRMSRSLFIEFRDRLMQKNASLILPPLAV